MDEGSRYFRAILINKLQVSCKDRKVKVSVILDFFSFPDLEKNYYSGGCVVISAVGVNQAHEMHQWRKERSDISKLLDLQILTNKTLC